MIKGLAFALALGGLTHAGHHLLDAQRLVPPNVVRDTLPSPEALRLLSLGHRSLVADYYWLRALSHFGDETKHTLVYPDLVPLISRVLALDPYFGGAYQFAGTALTLNGMDPKIASALLTTGLTYRPDLWQIPFYLGFNLYYFEEDYGRAAEMLARAATMKGAPPVAGLLATRLAAEAGRPEVGIRLIDTMLEGITDAKLRAEYEGRRAMLQVERDVRFLDEAIARHRQETGAPPRTMSELVRPGLLAREPIDPFGQPYALDGEGRVVLPAGVVRLRLSDTGRPGGGVPETLRAPREAP
jgi:hypothetical protein